MKSRSHANRGKTFEEFVKLANERYRMQGLACVHKVPTEFIPLRNGTGRVVGAKVETKSCVDYIGRYKDTPVAIEAKHSSESRIKFSAIQPHQAKFLDDWDSDKNAVAIVLVSFQLDRIFAVPWIFWKSAMRNWVNGKGKTETTVNRYGFRWTSPNMASVSAEQLHPGWEIKQGGQLLLPYLDVIDRMRLESAEC